MRKRAESFDALKSTVSSGLRRLTPCGSDEQPDHFRYAARMDDARRERILRQHLRTDQLLGVEAVPVNDVATAASIGEPSSPSQITTPPVTSQTPAVAPRVAAPPRSTDAPATADLFGTKPSPASAAAASALAPSTAYPDDTLPPVPKYNQTFDLNTKIHLLHGMDVNEVRSCRKCGLCNGRTQTVFGEGDPDANLLFIGEGPGENEDLQGRPFVGPSGEKLDEMIKAMGLDRKQVYIANVVKCRPPQNRAPTTDEVHACWDYLKRQIETIQPRVIVTLGGPATKQILQTNKGITAIRGIWHSFDALKPAGPSVPVMPTFHPAYLLRAYTPENRKKVWNDLQKAMKLLKA